MRNTTMKARHMHKHETNQPTLNRAFDSEYVGIIESLDGDEAGRRQCWDYIKGSTAVFAGKPVYMSYIPRLFDAATKERFDYIARTTYSVLTKIMGQYLVDPAYRTLFNLDERLEELILLPRDYDALLPCARVDLFLDEDTMQATFCEFNADGSSGMNEDREACLSVMDSEPMKRFSAGHTVRTCTESLFDGWVDEFMSIYGTYAFKVEHPHVAIVDFLENSVTEEFKIYASLFAKRGIDFSIYDVRELDFDGEHLIGRKAFLGRDNAPIDAVWRRCVTRDVLDHWDESQQLIEAVRQRKVALIGSFAGHIAHDKQVFGIIGHPETRKLLTEEENALMDAMIPYTAFLAADSVDLDAVKAEKDRWIIKPTDAYGSRSVYAGRDFSPEEWSCIIDAHADGASGCPFLVQRFCVPYTTPAIPLYDREEDYTADPKMFFNLSGLYIYNGRFAGVFSRLGPGSIILGRNGGVTAASLWVDC